MKSASKNTVWLLTIGAFFAFFVFGFSDNLKGPALPALLTDLKISYSTGGTILLGVFLGFMAATLTTGLLADAAGHKTVLVLAGVSMALGVTSFSSLSNPLLLTISTAMLGFGLGSLELGCNALIVELHPDDKARKLNLMSVMHGMGSMLAPLYAGWLLSSGSSWRNVYRWDLILIGLLLAYFLLVRFPPTQNTKSEKIDFHQLGRAAATPEMIGFYAAISFYVAIELGLASWMVEFLQRERGASVASSTQALSVFFGLIMLGRFVGSFFVDRVGHLKSILLAALAASLCAGLGLFGPSKLTFLLPASGFFLSIIFPTITAAASEGHQKNLNTILGLLFTFAGFGGLLGPWLVGLTSDFAGLKFGFGLNVLFGLLTAATAFVLLRLSRKNPTGELTN